MSFLCGYTVAFSFGEGFGKCFFFPLFLPWMLYVPDLVEEG
jgi:hypothetical protein